MAKDYTFEYAYHINYDPASGFSLGSVDTTGVVISSDQSTLVAHSTVDTAPTTNIPQSQTLLYEGTAVDDGKYVGAVFYDTNDKKLFLVTTDLSLSPSSAITIDYADSAVPGSKADFKLGKGGSAVKTGSGAPCFLPGTMIATPDGEVAVEALRPGDLVRVTDGRAMPVIWVGRQTVSRRFGDPARILPVRVRAGALGPAQPQRDLLLSPDHALLVDDVLIQVGALVNNVSILRDTGVPQTFMYYHVEVADHALLYAEGVPAETFIDNVERLAFDNWDEHEAAGDGSMIVEMDLPRAKSARQVPAATRARLAERAAALSAEVIAAA